MRPGVSIEPDPADTPPAAGPAGGGAERAAPPARGVLSPGVLGALTALRARGADPDENVTVTLDGRGRLVDLMVTDLAVQGGRRGVERAVRAAFDAAADTLDRLRQEQAQQMMAEGDLQVAGLTDRLQELSDHADARLQDAFARLREQADRIGGSA